MIQVLLSHKKEILKEKDMSVVAMEKEENLGQDEESTESTDLKFIPPSYADFSTHSPPSYADFSTNSPGGTHQSNSVEETFLKITVVGENTIDLKASKNSRPENRMELIQAEEQRSSMTPQQPQDEQPNFEDLLKSLQPIREEISSINTNSVEKNNQYGTECNESEFLFKDKKFSNYNAIGNDLTDLDLMVLFENTPVEAQPFEGLGKMMSCLHKYSYDQNKQQQFQVSQNKTSNSGMSLNNPETHSCKRIQDEDKPLPKTGDQTRQSYSDVRSELEIPKNSVRIGHLKNIFSKEEKLCDFKESKVDSRQRSDVEVENQYGTNPSEPVFSKRIHKEIRQNLPRNGNSEGGSSVAFEKQSNWTKQTLIVLALLLNGCSASNSVNKTTDSILEIGPKKPSLNFQHNQSETCFWYRRFRSNIRTDKHLPNGNKFLVDGCKLVFYNTTKEDMDNYCYYVNVGSIYSTCKKINSSFDPYVNEWSTWSSCNNTCGNRTRTCIEGRCLGYQEEYQNCTATGEQCSSMSNGSITKTVVSIVGSIVFIVVVVVLMFVCIKRGIYKIILQTCSTNTPTVTEMEGLMDTSTSQGGNTDGPVANGNGNIKNGGVSRY